MEELHSGKISIRSFFYFSLLASTWLCIGSCKVNDDCNLFDYPNAPNSSWFTSISGSKEESHGHYVLTCSDGGFLQVGETGFLPNSKILVVKIDSVGNFVWKKEFAEGGHNLGNSARESSDAYWLCGQLNGNSALIKLNKEDGSVIFSKTYTNGGNNAFEQIAFVNDKIVAVGYTNAQDKTNTFYTEGQAYIGLLDNEGKKLQTFSADNQMVHAYRVEVYQNEIIVGGLTNEAKDYALFKMDTLGNQIWTKTYGGDKDDHCFGMDLATDGTIFLTGHTLSGTKNWDTYTLKINQEGTKIWGAKKGNPRGFKPKYIHDEAWDIKSTDDGGCIVVAGTGDESGYYKRCCGDNGDNSSRWHVYLIKYDGSGTVEWQKTYNDSNKGDWAGEAISLTTDGGAMVAVDDGSFGFLKIESF